MQADPSIQSDTATEPPPAATIALVVGADVQDHLIAACNDLQRLQVLLADACQVLLSSFHSASRELSQHRRRSPERELATVLHEIQGQLDNAVTALQFHDMTSQLISHTHLRLRNCADQLAGSLFAEDEDGAAVIERAPDRPNPVTQSEMDAGSIELF